MGKPLNQARGEAEKSATLCDYYALHGPAFLQPVIPPAAPAGARVAYEPLGVVLAIMPWNFPIWQVIRAAVPALMAGNTVLLKHSPNVTGSALAIEDLFRDAGLPGGVFQILLTTPAPIAALIADARIAGVTLTGSVEAGRKVAAIAGAELKPGVFELGGSDAFLVLADADIQHAARVAAHARLLNSGQSCVCAKRFIVPRVVRRQFEAALTAEMKSRRIGDPADPATVIGPLARADLREKLHTQVTRSVRAGARARLGGTLLPGPGFFYPPTVLTQVRPGMPAYHEELFGPVASVIEARDEDDAVRIANDTEFGLGAAVFSRSAACARAIASRIEAGCVFINDFVRSDPTLPFGGVKRSGFGRELGPWGLRAFTNVRTIVG
jgi:succinate-semialdehyde dehydrogenase/glutarate-semialdehyde dehydrogenase